MYWLLVAGTDIVWIPPTASGWKNESVFAGNGICVFQSASGLVSDDPGCANPETIGAGFVVTGTDGAKVTLGMVPVALEDDASSFLRAGSADSLSVALHLCNLSRPICAVSRVGA